MSHRVISTLTRSSRRFLECSRVVKLQRVGASPFLRQLSTVSIVQRRGTQVRSLHLSGGGHPLLKEVIPFKLSDIGEGIKEVTIKEWFVHEGDYVNQFDQICEVQSDKASVTITSRYDGIVKKLHYQVDDIALVGTALVDIEVAESSVQKVEEKEIQEGDAIQVGRSSAEESVHLPAMGGFNKAIAAPAVRRIAAEYKIDLKNVLGTGKDGRVLKEDVLNYMDKGGVAQKAPQASTGQRSSTVPPPPTPTQVKAPSPQAPAAAATPTPAKTLTPRLFTTPEDRTEKISGYTKTMIKTMTMANQIPHFGYGDEINVSKLIALRQRLKPVAAQYNIKLTMLPLFMKSMSLALAQFPILNASMDVENNTITYKGAHNIGLAVDSKNGLIVPNVKNCESKSILEIASDIQTVVSAALSGSVKPDDLRGGTFTISNIGSMGGRYCHPVILPPEVAIVAIGASHTVPKFDKEGKINPAEVVNVSFSCDHRIIDGATACRFSNVWKSYIEDPSSMLLHLK